MGNYLYTDLFFSSLSLSLSLCVCVCVCVCVSVKVWKRMLEKDCNHQFLAFEEQLSSLRLDTQQPTQLSDGEAES